MPLRLLIHAPTEAALARARSNALNFLRDTPDAACEIVTNAAAVRAAIETPDAETDRLLILCANSLRAQGIDAPAGLRIVPAAVTHIARRQSEGWSYMRA